MQIRPIRRPPRRTRGDREALGERPSLVCRGPFWLKIGFRQTRFGRSNWCRTGF
jgi:hypothetical protein